MKKALFIFFSLLVGFKAHSQTVITDSILVENHYRTFHFVKPAGSTKKFNLIFALHGSGGNGKGMIKPAEKLQARAQQEGVFLVYPDGYKKYWNECRKSATSAANQENVNEQAFFTGMAQYFKKRYRVNGKRFFAVGMSGGGHMAYKLALTLPDQCKAINAVIANLPDSTNFDCVASGKPVAVLITNGTDDTVNPYGGGPMVVNGSSFGSVLSTDRSFQYWANLAGYRGQPTIEELPDANPRNKQTITRYTYKAKGKPEVALLKVTGGNHNFPEDMDAFLEAWEFFKRQMKK